MIANANGRKLNGRFALGNPGGPGRPPIARERRYAETLATVCTVDDWREICERAVKDAKAGNRHAREWLSKYLLGEPEAVAKVLHAHFAVGASGGIYANADPELILQAKAALARLEESSKGSYVAGWE
ncbi:MAG: hypothetical protein GX575_29215 [Candidatus Anammoximicrobium sp.]|nr:hypothetical protein [Candidatus Anammoximicrobium sp.]